MFKEMARLLVVFLILALVASSVEAKKPIKLSDAKMAEVEGAFIMIPLVLVVTLGLTLALVNARSQTHESNKKYIKENPEASVCPAPPIYRQGYKSPDVGNNIISKDDPICQKYYNASLRTYGTAVYKESAMALVSVAGGELAGPALGALSELKQVKTIVEPIRECSPVIAGAGRPIIEAQAKFALTEVPNCAIDNDFQSNQTMSCVGEKYNEKVISNPLLWISAGSGALLSYSASETGKGNSGWPVVTTKQIDTVAKGLSKVKDDTSDIRETTKKLTPPVETPPLPKNITVPPDNLMCIDPNLSRVNANQPTVISQEQLEQSGWIPTAKDVVDSIVVTNPGSAPSDSSGSSRSSGRSSGSGSSDSSNHSSSGGSSSSSGSTSSSGSSSGVATHAGSAMVVSEAKSIAAKATPTQNLSGASATTRARFGSGM